MKNISDYIIEKFKINSKNVHKSNDIENKIGEKTIFTKEEIDEINEYSNDLPIIPDIITNYPDFQPTNPNRSGKSYNSGIMVIGYYMDIGNRTHSKHDNNYVRIRKDKDDKQYFVRFVKADDFDTYFYPKEADKYFKTIKECFDCIKEKWNELKFSEVIKEYK